MSISRNKTKNASLEDHLPCDNTNEQKIEVIEHLNKTDTFQILSKSIEMFPCKNSLSSTNRQYSLADSFIPISENDSNADNLSIISSESMWDYQNLFDKDIFHPNEIYTPFEENIRIPTSMPNFCNHQSSNFLNLSEIKCRSTVLREDPNEIDIPFDEKIRIQTSIPNFCN